MLLRDYYEMFARCPLSSVASQQVLKNNIFGSIENSSLIQSFYDTLIKFNGFFYKAATQAGEISLNIALQQTLRKRKFWDMILSLIYFKMESTVALHYFLAREAKLKFTNKQKLYEKLTRLQWWTNKQIH